jgi:hypothetical protein
MAINPEDCDDRRWHVGPPGAAGVLAGVMMRRVRGSLDPTRRDLIRLFPQLDGGDNGAASDWARATGSVRHGIPGGTSLDEVSALVDWAELDRLLADISASAKGEAGWPPLALFRALLLATWHDLSDVRLADGVSANCPPIRI